MTAVDTYWTDHTVRTQPYRTAAASLAFLDWRFAKYPLFRELMALWGDHAGQTILDYGCGPGNDISGFLAYANPALIVGMDCSPTALAIAARRVALHDPGRVTLMKVSDADPTIPLLSGSVDFVHSEGVLHHASHPEALLGEFHRVLRPGGTANVMVHNRDSLWINLYVAWQRQIVKGIDTRLSLDAAFQRSTDGTACPISVAYHPSDFLAICEAFGFRAEYVGGYFNRLELDLWRQHGREAIADRRLGADSRAFLSGLEAGAYPMRDGLPAGLFGCYRLSR